MYQAAILSKTGNVRKKENRGPFVQPLLQWKCNLSIAYSECVILALGIEEAKLIRHFVICGLSGSTKLLHVI